jgi:predicted outer membrane repeat protein
MAGGNVTGADGGGAIFTRGDLTVVQSSFLGNNTVGGGSGGAIRIGDTSNPDPQILIANVTFNGNTAEEDGGAIANGNDGIVTLLNTTLSGNDASGSNMTDGGGAIWNGNTTAANFTVSNSIFGDSTGAGENCAGNAITDGGNNLQFSPDTTSCGALITIGDPVLDAASIFAGPNLFVFTMAPTTAMTPALGAGNPTVCSDPPVLDSDGTGRVGIRPDGDPNCDIGAFESVTLVPVELQQFSVE